MRNVGHKAIDMECANLQTFQELSLDIKNCIRDQFTMAATCLVDTNSVVCSFFVEGEERSERNGHI
jgi:hypothetical protein